ncbi:RDD family protein [Phenylobacterium sp.]|uniref:RDD family protein n=1 Tax=Phenylobacterium sp. TaxID=1871053 RepID=UPI00261DB02A|nr:RDD family protein [Phenylobacterium sp.]
MRSPIAALRAPRSTPAPAGPRPFVTPEGVDLRLAAAAYADRLSAFVLDALIIVGVLIGFTILAFVAAWGFRNVTIGADGAFIIWLLGAFLLRNGYFIAFEVGPHAATPGKRLVGLRVIARDGGRLTADAVVARNVMRELEIFLPASFLLARGQGVDAELIGLGGVVWSGVFVLFPLFNRDRLRLGDVAAGTMVVKAPKVTLPPELVAERAVDDLVFSEAQVDAYGIKELQVLEQVLRRGDRRTMADVARRIRVKIAWDGPTDIPDRSFLSAYYAALRARLEARALFGHRRQDKFDRP